MMIYIGHNPTLLNSTMDSIEYAALFISHNEIQNVKVRRYIIVVLSRYSTPSVY